MSHNFKTKVMKHSENHITSYQKKKVVLNVKALIVILKSIINSLFVYHH